MDGGMTHINLTPKEINIIVQAIRIASEDGSVYEYAKKAEIEQLRNKLQNVKD